MVKKGVLPRIYLIFNIVIYLIVAAVWITIPEETTLNLSLSILATLITLGLTYFYRVPLGKLASSSQFKNYLNASLSIFLILCIIGLLNYLAYKNPVQWDLTQLRQNSLSNETMDILQQFSKEEQAELEFILVARTKQWPRWKLLIELYQLALPEMKYKKVDPDLRPEILGQLGVNKSEFLYISYKGRHAIIEAGTELAVSRGLLKVGRIKDPKIYYTQGHGEVSWEGTQDHQMSGIKKVLENHHFQVQSLIMKKSGLPKDASLIIILGPTQAFSDNEVTALRKYLLAGGRLMMGFSYDYAKQTHFKLRQLAREFGIDYQEDLVIDQASHVSGSKGFVPLVTQYKAKNELFENFQQVTFFPLTSSFKKVKEGRKDYDVKLMAYSSPMTQSWGERNFASLGANQLSYNANEDVMGPLPMMAISRAKNSESRLVTFGNGTFLMNSYIGHGGNAELFLRSVNWAVGESFFIATKKSKANRLPVMISAPQVRLIFYFCVLFCPLILILSSVVVYRRRLKL